MRIGQTSAIAFVSKFLASVLGFVATIYFSRTLGAEVIGLYSIVMAVTNWINLTGNIGIGMATRKRISEGIEQGEYMSASLIFSGCLIFLSLIVLFVGHEYVESYVGNFGAYATISVVWVIACLSIINWIKGFIRVFLNSTHLVHVAAILKTVQTGFRSIIQIALVIAGFSLIGMFAGYAVGAGLVIIVGYAYLSIRPKIPSREHFFALVDYAKYSWVGGLKVRAYNDVDLLLLGVFVSNTLIGVYSVAWTITMFLHMFSNAIATALFPEISKVSKQQSDEAASELIQDALAYGGLIIIPGLIGGSLLSDRLLEVYGQEFVQGTEVFPFLLLSLLFYTFMSQILNSLNAIDRPDAAFWINMIFLGSNAVLNVVLIWYVGWVGAAVASALSALIGLAISYVSLKRILAIKMPVKEISQQFGAALCMGAIIWRAELLITGSGLVQNNFIIVFGLVLLGAGIYIGTLLLISVRFREIVSRNLPMERAIHVLQPWK